jgi:hypothetical protein
MRRKRFLAPAHYSMIGFEGVNPLCAPEFTPVRPCRAAVVEASILTNPAALDCSVGHVRGWEGRG